MKSIFNALIALTFATALTSVASASSETGLMGLAPVAMPVQVIIDQPAAVEIPDNVTTLEALNEWALQFGVTQMSELTWYEAQTKYYEILRASFVGSKALSDAFDEKAMKDGVKIGSGVVTIAADAYLAKAWLSGATPTFQVLKDVWLASRGETGRMTSIGKKTLTSLLEAGKSLKVPKNLITTAAIGTFVYIEVKTFFVINMSEAQYNATIKSLDVKIATLQKIKASIADRRADTVVTPAR